jgi:Transposase
MTCFFANETETD